MQRAFQIPMLYRPTDDLIECDVAVYGATPGGICSAIAAARHGERVTIIGGWREKQLGGMMSGGLGETDLRNYLALGGIAREFFDRIDEYYGRAQNVSFRFEPSVAKKIFEQMVAEEPNIRVVWSRGIDAARKDGRRLRGFHTRDGLSVSANVFIDGTYEGDLAAFAGVNCRIGREAIYEYGETLAGIRPDIASTFSYGGSEMYVDTWNTPGDPSSGLIPQIGPLVGAAGDGDGRVQGFNFRVTTTRTPSNRQPFMTAPPDGYSDAKWELFFRYIKKATDAGFEVSSPTSFAIMTPLPGGKYDCNNYRGISLDYIGGNADYVEAGFDYISNRRIDYDLREYIWQEHIRYTQGWWWAQGGSGEPRVPAGLRQSMRDNWLPLDEYTDPWPGDPVGWATQLYVREGRRIVGDLVVTQADVRRGDGTPSPFSAESIATASYEVDSHYVTRYAQEYAPGQWRAQNEGQLAATAGGANNMFPIPFRCIRPRESECDNLLVTFAVSATHVAFAPFRMEATSMCVGHAAGVASSMALDGPTQIPVQQINVDDLRGQLRVEGCSIDQV